MEGRVKGTLFPGAGRRDRGAQSPGEAETHCPIRGKIHTQEVTSQPDTASACLWTHPQMQTSMLSKPTTIHAETHLLAMTKLRMTSVTATPPPHGCCRVSVDSVTWLHHLAWTVASCHLPPEMPPQEPPQSYPYLSALLHSTFTSQIFVKSLQGSRHCSRNWG